VLLEIANDINTGSDFTAVIERILGFRDLLRIQAACLAIIDITTAKYTSRITNGGGKADEIRRH
jgi:hypothetical protein